MEKTTIKLEDYYQSLAEEDRLVIEKVANLIFEIAPEIEYAVWKGIFWGGSEQAILGFGNTENVGSNKKVVRWFLIGLAKQKNYYSIYVNAAKDKQYLTKLYKDQLGKVKVGSSNITFTKIENVDLSALKEMFAEAIKIHYT